MIIDLFETKEALALSRRGVIHHALKRERQIGGQTGRTWSITPLRGSRFRWEKFIIVQWMRSIASLHV